MKFRRVYMLEVEASSDKYENPQTQLFVSLKAAFLEGETWAKLGVSSMTITEFDSADKHGQMEANREWRYEPTADRSERWVKLDEAQDEVFEAPTGKTVGPFIPEDDPSVIAAMAEAGMVVRALKMLGTDAGTATVEKVSVKEGWNGAPTLTVELKTADGKTLKHVMQEVRKDQKR